MKVSIIGNVPQSFVDAEVQDILNLNKNRQIDEISFERISDDEVKEIYTLVPVGIDRTRRITGYLVGNMDNWNNAKKAEEHDRVKHTLD